MLLLQKEAWVHTVAYEFKKSVEKHPQRCLTGMFQDYIKLVCLLGAL